MAFHSLGPIDVPDCLALPILCWPSGRSGRIVDELAFA